MKLVEILARELKEWPEGISHVEQFSSGALAFFSDKKHMNNIGSRLERADDWTKAEVTRAQWEAERARIATNQQAKAEAREIARTGAMTNEEQELADIACGKRSKEDQALWDKVATDLFVRWSMEYDTENDRKETIKNAMASADAFMAERAKRMKG